MSLAGQDIVNVDSLYFQSLKLYKDQAFSKALSKADQGLEIAPDYTDIRILRINIAQQISKIDSASKDIFYLHEYKKKTENYNFFNLVHKQVFFYKDVTSLSRFLFKISPYYKDDIDFQLSTAEAYLGIENARKANRIIKSIRKTNLTDKQKYRIRIMLKKMGTNAISLNQELLSFLGDFPIRKTWNTTSIGYAHLFKWGSLGSSITRSKRFVDQGILYKIEAYPQLGPKLYAHIDLNYSSKNDFYQDYGVSTSLYYTFFKKIEFEAGFKYLDFDTATFLTSIIGCTLYERDYYINLRAAIGPNIQENYIQNYQLTARRYLNDSESYLFAKIGTGISPDEALQFTQIVNTPRLKSYFALAGINKWFNSYNLNLSAGYQLQEITRVKRGNQIVASIGGTYRF